MIPKSSGKQAASGLQQVAVVSTTATKSHLWDFSSSFGSLPEVICDWLSGVHYLRQPIEPRNSGRVLKITPDGEVEWENQSWETIHCSSSDTSLRVKCDGHRIWFAGNIGRFQESDNLRGLTVAECLDKWKSVLRRMGLPVDEFGTRFRVMPDAGSIATRAWLENDVAWRGTTLTRVDLAGNFSTSDFPMLCQSMTVRKIGQAIPIQGKYGPTWGYGAKRGGWWKAKIYDKTAELQGKRRVSSGATVGRFEVELGREYLKREGLDSCEAWVNGEGVDDMGQVMWGRFAQQAFRAGAEASSFADIPQALQLYAYLWKDGKDVRSMTSRTTYFRVRKQLLAFGIDVGVPCNVVALTRPVQQVTVEWLPALRRA